MTQANQSPRQNVFELYVSTCSELFSAYGLQLYLEKSPLQELQKEQTQYISVVSGTARELRIVSTLCLELNLLKNIYPLETQTPQDSELEDWCRELNNQLVGRLKNKLLGFGCELKISIPILISGKDLQSIRPPNSEINTYFFTSEQGLLIAELAGEFKPDFCLKEVEEPQAEQEILFEGSHLLF